MCREDAYDTAKVFDRMDYVFWELHPVHIFADHRNLPYVCAPMALHPNSPLHVLSRVHYWTVRLSSFYLVIEYIAGTKQLFADLLTR